ncbi:MAG: alanine--tRNA ligase [Chloroflexota bacterium]|nr:alanine--tRNA ligase [Chloroflexota bacterium]
MRSDDLRRAFLAFFEGKGHAIVPSSSLIPHGDPTLLLTSAGMVQFKPYFTGQAVAPSPRLTSCQKCFRVSDIDSVGDSTHLTFFEMLGNFSVGDYFKREAIQWAWEFVIDRLHLPQERLWVSVFLDDDEAYDYWRQIGVAEERIVRFGEEDNFWGPAGDTGPCGPCSEILYDLGEGVGCGRPDCGPSCDCGRFSEIWNLVFTQYDQREDGSRVPLPRPNIDTGMGLERTAAVLQGKASVYETDLFVPLLDSVSRLAGRRYGEDKVNDRSLRIVAEHGRAVTFLLADGVIPSNEGRGYVLRRVLRRAVLFGRKLGLAEPFLSDLADVTISHMQRQYPELGRERKYIETTIKAEESRFAQTLEVGLTLLDGIVEEAQRRGDGLIRGEDVFRLYDTYGFPREITAEIAADNGLSLDDEGFEAEMERQRERARAAQQTTLSDTVVLGDRASAIVIPRSTGFVGYDKLRHKSTIVVLLPENEWPEEESIASVSQGQNVGVIIRETPFYGEMGGQVGDTGEIRGPNGRVVVSDTTRTADDLIVHHGEVVEGTMAEDEAVTATVDRERRLDIMRNHTATHLVQAALRHVLGEDVRQSGSLVAPQHLRFDFTHQGAPTKEQLAQVQHMVNGMIRDNLPVRSRVMPHGEALEAGALAFFDEKYGDEVRVLEIGEPAISRELCGGTHVARTGDIGFIQIVAESSIGAGIRRIEALTGRGAEALIEERLSLMERVADELKAPVSEIGTRIASLQATLDAERKKAQALERQVLLSNIDSIVSQAESVDGVTVLAARVPASDMDALRQVGDVIRERLGSALVVLGAVYGGRPNFVAMATPDLVERGLHAGDIVKQVAAVTGGGGGGKAQMGQAGGRDATKLDEALKLAKRLVVKRGDTGA